MLFGSLSTLFLLKGQRRKGGGHMLICRVLAVAGILISILVTCVDHSTTRVRESKIFNKDLHLDKTNHFLQEDDSASLSSSSSLWGADLPPRWPHERSNDHTSAVSSSDHPMSSAADNASLRGGKALGSPMHVVFIGDSLTRYPYLDLVYRVHHHSGRQHISNITPPRSHFILEPLPPSADNCSISDSANNCSSPHRPKDFMGFFRHTTAHYNGSMVCDCSRNEHSRSFDHTIENRWYRHPTRQLHLTFMQQFGDTPMLARSRFDVLNATTHLPVDANIRVVNETNDAFYYRGISLLTFATKYVPTIQPPPTHIVINIGMWGFQTLEPTILDVMYELRKHTKHLIWRSTSHSKLGEFSMRPAGSKRAWVTMKHKRQRLDVAMKRLCVSATIMGPAPETKGAPGHVAQTATNTTPPPLCHYFELPSIPGSHWNGQLMTDDMFADIIHPQPFVYEHWNRKLWPFLRSLP
jgi:hypothetical protein